MSEMLRNAIVRIRRDADQQVVGVGFLVDAGKKTILTCAHVINAAIEDRANKDKPRSLISLDFPFIDNGSRLDARVTHFFPKKRDNSDDIALLEILDDLPAGASAVTLATSDSYNGHEFGVYGFPYDFEDDGQYVEGRLQEILANQRLQAVGVTNLGHFVEEGFSGGPVYDKDLGAVVGMMVAIADEREKRVAYICPSDMIAALHPNLQYRQIEHSSKPAAAISTPSPADGKWLQRVDIFISSPSDVAEEREAILRVIERLNRLSSIRSRYLLNPLLYEKEVPPQAGDYAQMIVDRYMAVEDSYLLICLMWNRMGTSFTHPHTGEEFQSGTEYEFTVGYRSNSKTGKPHLLVYRKAEDDPNADSTQKEKVEQFFQKFEGHDAIFRGLYKQFPSISDFENMLFEHIERIIHDDPPSTTNMPMRSPFETRMPTRTVPSVSSNQPQSEENKVFICYSDLDGMDLAQYVHESFHKMGCPAWIDYQYINEGYDEDEFDEVIDEAISTCSSVIVLVTPAVRKKPVSTYWREAIRKDKQIVPVFFVQPDDAPLKLRHRRGFHIPVVSDLPNRIMDIVQAVGCVQIDDNLDSHQPENILTDRPIDAQLPALNEPDVITDKTAYEYVLQLLSQREYQQIISWSNQLTDNVFSAELHSIRALAFNGLGQPSMVRQELEAAKNLAPRDPERYLESAENHLDDGRVREAFNDFEKALHLNPALQDIVYLETSAVVVLVRHADQLPMPLFDEIEGRDDLVATATSYLESGQGILLYGMGGIGKTALSTVIAKRHLSEDRSVLWVNVGSARLETLLNAIGQEIERELDKEKQFNQAETTTQKSEYIAEWLRKEQPLLVLDDAWNPAETKQLLEAVLPAKCPVIVTTRRDDFEDMDGLIKFDLPKLSSDAAVKLYRTISDASDDEQAIESLCQKLEYHPLAIRLAALKAKRGNRTATQMLSEIEAQPAQNSIRAIFDVVIDDVDKHATEAFRVIGALPVTRVTEHFVAIVLGEEDVDVGVLLHDLADRGLINPTTTPDNEPFYAVHDLTYAYAHDLLVEQNRVDELEHRVVQAACRYVDSFSGNTPDDFRKLTVEKPTLIASISRARGYQDHDSIYALVDGLVTFLDYQGYSIDHLNILEIALESADKQADKRKLARYWNESANISIKLGRYAEAISFLEQALSVTREFGDRRSEGSIIGNLANVYTSLGKSDRAIEYYELALNITREIGDRASEATILNNLSSVWDARGDKRKALIFYEQALPIRRAAGDRRGEATTLSNIGATWSALGEKRKALESYEHSLSISRDIGDRVGESSVLNNIGSAWSDLGEKRKALEFYEQALPLRRAVGDRAGEATTLNNIGSAWDALGEKRKALEFYEQALPLSRAVGDRRGEATTLGNIAASWSALGEMHKALEFYEQALPLSHAIGDRYIEARLLRDIGVTWSALGEKRKALELYEQALPLSRAVGDRGGEATTLNNIGGVWSALGEKRKALELYEQALPLSRAVGDRGGEAITLNNIGNAWDALGEKHKALEFYEQALPLSRAVGDRSGEAITLNNIAGIYFQNGDMKEAINTFQQVVKIFQGIGAVSEEAALYLNIATVLQRMGRIDEAIDYVEQGRTILVKYNLAQAASGATLMQYEQMLEQLRRNSQSQPSSDKQSDEIIRQWAAFYAQNGVEALREILKEQLSADEIEQLIVRLANRDSQKDDQRTISISGNVQGSNVNIGGQQSFSGNITIGGESDNKDAEEDE